MKRQKFVGVAIVVVALGAALAQKPDHRKHQYHSGEISIPPASESEPFLREFSPARALAYVEEGATAWTRERKCLSCHTNATYMVTRPSLTGSLGRPSEELRTFAIQELAEYRSTDLKKLKSGIKPTQVAYLAQGLAEWDAHVTGKLSAETEDALDLMLQVQGESGDWSNVDTWPPFESNNYQSTTVAALAMATAPGWLEGRAKDGAVEKVKRYLKQGAPHDYGRLLLLWVATRWTGLLDEDVKQELIENVWSHQRKDGGWSIRTFAAPEEWGKGNRAEKLRSEDEFRDPPSDGHQTGLCLLVLRQAGVPATDPRLQRAVKWLLGHQRESGRWWTRSLNTDKFHFITYSGTCYPLLALDSCGLLEPM